MSCTNIDRAQLSSYGEMIENNNTPEWNQAPEWANWLAQDADGYWYWFNCKPVPVKKEGFFSSEENEENYRCELARRGEPNALWALTREARPEVKE